MSQEKPETAKSQLSTALDFKQKANERINGVELELPSGAVVRCKRPKVSAMIAEGKIPQDVAAMLFSRTRQGQSQQNNQSVSATEFPKLYEFQKKVVLHSVVSPQVVEGEADYDDNQISIDDFEDQDLAFVTQYVQSGNADLALFRRERTGSDAGSDLPEVSGAAA